MSGIFVDFEECKQKVSLLDVLRVLRLAEQFRESNCTWRGLCPFPSHVHNPVRPNSSGFSFGMHEGIWKWKCWGDCGVTGNVITFVQRFLRLEPAHVRLWFYEHFANRLSAKSTDGSRKGESQSRDWKQAEKNAHPMRQTTALDESTDPRQPEASEPAEQYKPIRFRLNLDSDVPYLQERGLTPETIERFGIGLCGRGMLKGYIAIPVWEHPRGTFPLGYIGRWAGEDYDEDQHPRYKCPPGFPTSRLIFGLQEALETPPDWPLIVVEGCFKVFHLFQNGFPNTVSTFTSSISDEQAALLAATGRPIVLLFDGNDAGRNGMSVALPKLAAKGFVRIIHLDDDVEPDDLPPKKLHYLLSDYVSAQ